MTSDAESRKGEIPLKTARSRTMKDAASVIPNEGADAKLANKLTMAKSPVSDSKTLQNEQQLHHAVAESLNSSASPASSQQSPHENRRGATLPAASRNAARNFTVIKHSLTANLAPKLPAAILSPTATKSVVPSSTVALSQSVINSPNNEEQITPPKDAKSKSTFDTEVCAVSHIPQNKGSNEIRYSTRAEGAFENFDTLKDSVKAVEERPAIKLSAENALAASINPEVEKAARDGLRIDKSPTPARVRISVNRRSPLNPIGSEKLGRFRKPSHAAYKGMDPALAAVPIWGKLSVCISTTSFLIFIFLQEQIFNFLTFNGRCITPVLYPEYSLSTKPWVVNFGYGACEYNLNTRSDERCAVGECAGDEGWPSQLVKGGGLEGLPASWQAPNPRIYKHLGGLETNYIRNYHEFFRVFWSICMHGSWIHILLNVISQIQILWMLEPDWGLTRTALLFFVGGVTGNLLSAVADPCSLTTGSSGAMYGLLGALIPYCVEYWKSLPRPCCVLSFMILVIILGLVTGMTGITDNYAHMGGCLGGILFGFGTITNVSLLDKCSLWQDIALSTLFRGMLSPETQKRLEARRLEIKKRGTEKRVEQLAKRIPAAGKKGRLIRFIKYLCEADGRPPCKVSMREWIVRLSCMIGLILTWTLLILYLIVPSLYKNSNPPGQVHFSGPLGCNCCQIYESAESAANPAIAGGFELDAGRNYGNRGMWWCWSDTYFSDRYCKAPDA